MNLKDCHNFSDFRKLAQKKLPSPIFHYIDGGADDETTLRRNTDSFEDCDLVPNILANVGKPDLSTTLFERKIDYKIVNVDESFPDYIVNNKKMFKDWIL